MLFKIAAFLLFCTGQEYFKSVDGKSQSAAKSDKFAANQNKVFKRRKKFDRNEK